ncbi:MAG TPA: hypothetical protein VFT31_03465 [Kribbella sp.]|nr:hypothetical protein [Kribbella sp.]
MSKRDTGRKREGKRLGLSGDGAGEAHERPGQPGSWRDVVRVDYDYPDEIDDLSRRDRRRAKRDWRRDDHAARVAWLRERRQAEPTSPVVAIVAVVILAIIVLGIGGGLPRMLRDDEPQGREIGLLTPSLPPERSTTEPADASPTMPSQTSTGSVPPVLTERPSDAATTAASDVASSWARVFYTRDPMAETYEELVARAAQYTTDEVARSFAAAGDLTYEALKADGGRSAVVSASVVAPRPDTAPVDTPTRISRLVTVTIDISGRRPDRVTVPLVVTLIPQESRWLISDVNGGTGP